MCLLIGLVKLHDLTVEDAFIIHNSYYVLAMQQSIK